MRGRRSVFLIAWGVLVPLIFATGACGGDDSSDGGSLGNATEGSSPTPFLLGSTLTIRGQQVALPPGVTYANLSPECQEEAAASTPGCLSDSKLLLRGKSYIAFDPSIPRVIARRIEPEDESDLRPLLGLISGTTSDESSSAPAPTP
jgi:hypothetical protein